MATSANGTRLADYGAAPRLIEIRAKLNVRNAPSRSAHIVRRVEPPCKLVADELWEAEPFLGNAHWYREAATGNYFWAGAGEPALTPASTQPGPAQVSRRADGTTLPLSIAKVKSVFGVFDFRTESNGAATILTPDWEAVNIVPLQHALLDGIGASGLRVHRKARPYFVAALDAIDAAGNDVSSRLLTCAGTFVVRHKAWNRDRELSPHSWGIAIDFNAGWNPYGRPPELPGRVGSVYELVPFFEAQGFAWGGYFSGASRDGMHFELARLDIT